MDREQRKFIQISRANNGFIVERSWTPDADIAKDLDELLEIIRFIYAD